MPDLPSPSSQDLEAIEALRLLGGLSCPHCKAPLDRSVVRNDRFRCPHCYRGHCPFCECRADVACRHRIAYMETERGPYREFRNFPGVMDPQYEVPWLPIASPFLLAYPEEEQRAAFGTAADLVEELYGARMSYQKPNSYLHFDLLRSVAGDGEILDNVNGGANIYFCARDPDATRAQAQQILRDLEAGFARLAASPPPTSPFLERVLVLDVEDCLYAMDDEFGERGHFCFAPGDAPLLAYAMWHKVVLWHLDRDDPPLRMTLPTVGSAVGFRCTVGLRFTSDGSKVGVRSLHLVENEAGEQIAPAYGPTGTTYLWDCATGTLSYREPSRLPFDLLDHSEIQEPDKRQRPALGGSMHNGETQLTVSDGTLRLRCPVSGAAPEIVIRLRGGIAHCAIAPDGERFAVIHASQDGTQLLFFRVPREAAHGTLRQSEESHEPTA